MDQSKNKRIEEILNSLDPCGSAHAPDYFYTRLKAKMQRHEQKTPSFLLRPVYALGAVLAILIINAFVIFQNKNAADTTALNDAETFQSIASEYSLNDNSAYLLEINPDK